MKSKAEYTETQDTLRADAEDQIKEQEEIAEDATEASDAWVEQLDQPPATQETAEALNQRLEELQDKIEVEHGEHKEKSADAIETQRVEVGEPARENEDRARESAEQLDARASQSGRYSREVSELAKAREEEAEFFRELKETDEADRDKETMDMNEAERIVREALQRARPFSL